jgi:VanZ family protein
LAAISARLRATPTRARVLAPLAWMAVIFYFSAQSDPSPGIGNFGHVVAHFTEYFILTGLWAWALLPALGVRALAVAFVVAVLYAISDEWHQSFVPRRDSDPVDVLVDGTGAATAVVVSYLLVRRAAPRRHPTSR